MTEQPNVRRKTFLGLAALFLFFAILIYLLLGDMAYVGDNGLLTAFYTVLSFILALFVLLALLMLVCYSNPKIGAIVAKRLPYLMNAWRVPMKHFGLFGAHIESASDEKHQATKRMQQRHMRRHYMRQNKQDRD